MASIRTTTRALAKAIRPLGTPRQLIIVSSTSSCRRFAATEAAASTSSNPAPPPVGDAKIHKLVDDISSLSLLQAADLVSLLKTRLNITEIAMPASSGPVAAAAPVEEEAAIPEEKPKAKTTFTLRLDSFDAASKAKVIREVKATFANMNLMEAKKFAESVPQTLKENIPKEEAEKLKAAFEALGAKVVME